MEIKNIKQKARNLIDKLPDNSTWDDLQWRLPKRARKNHKGTKNTKIFSPITF